MQKDSSTKFDHTTQTLLRVYPLTTVEEKTAVITDEYCQTAAHASPKVSNANFIALLEFVPYAEINENSSRVCELPRKAQIQFDLPLIVKNISSASLASETSNTSNPYTQQRKKTKMSTNEKDIQTDLRVIPHILEEDQVATVYTDFQTQTSLTFEPQARDSNILLLLRENFEHTNDKELLISTFGQIDYSNLSVVNRASQAELIRGISINEIHERTKFLVDNIVSLLQNRLKDLLRIYQESKRDEDIEKSYLDRPYIGDEMRRNVLNKFPSIKVNKTHKPIEEEIKPETIQESQVIGVLPRFSHTTPYAVSSLHLKKHLPLESCGCSANQKTELCSNVLKEIVDDTIENMDKYIEQMKPKLEDICVCLQPVVEDRKSCACKELKKELREKEKLKKEVEELKEQPIELENDVKCPCGSKMMCADEVCKCKKTDEKTCKCDEVKEQKIVAGEVPIENVAMPEPTEPEAPVAIEITPPTPETVIEEVVAVERFVQEQGLTKNEIEVSVERKIESKEVECCCEQPLVVPCACKSSKVEQKEKPVKKDKDECVCEAPLPPPPQPPITIEEECTCKPSKTICECKGPKTIMNKGGQEKLVKCPKKINPVKKHSKPTEKVLVKSSKPPQVKPTTLKLPPRTSKRLKVVVKRKPSPLPEVINTKPILSNSNKKSEEDCKCKKDKKKEVPIKTEPKENVVKPIDSMQIEEVIEYERANVIFEQTNNNKQVEEEIDVRFLLVAAANREFEYNILESVSTKEILKKSAGTVQSKAETGCQTEVAVSTQTKISDVVIKQETQTKSERSICKCGHTKKKSKKKVEKVESEPVKEVAVLANIVKNVNEACSCTSQDLVKEINKPPVQVQVQQPQPQPKPQIQEVKGDEDVCTCQPVKPKFVSSELSCECGKEYECQCDNTEAVEEATIDWASKMKASERVNSPVYTKPFIANEDSCECDKEFECECDVFAPESKPFIAVTQGPSNLNKREPSPPFLKPFHQDISCACDDEFECQCVPFNSQTVVSSPPLIPKETDCKCAVEQKEPHCYCPPKTAAKKDKEPPVEVLFDKNNKVGDEFVCAVKKKQAQDQEKVCAYKKSQSKQEKQSEIRVCKGSSKAVDVKASCKTCVAMNQTQSQPKTCAAQTKSESASKASSGSCECEEDESTTTGSCTCNSSESKLELEKASETSCLCEIDPDKMNNICQCLMKPEGLECPCYQKTLLISKESDEICTCESPEDKSEDDECTCSLDEKKSIEEECTCSSSEDEKKSIEEECTCSLEEKKSVEPSTCSCEEIDIVIFEEECTCEKAITPIKCECASSALHLSRGDMETIPEESCQCPEINEALTKSETCDCKLIPVKTKNEEKETKNVEISCKAKEIIQSTIGAKFKGKKIKKSKQPVEQKTSYLFNRENEYHEPYMSGLNFGRYVNSSVVSLPSVHHRTCQKRSIEVPWNLIVLPNVDTYLLNIPTKSKSLKELSTNNKNDNKDYSKFVEEKKKELSKKRKPQANNMKMEGDFHCTYEYDVVYVEPYLEELNYEFNPEPADTPCTSKTEIPWDDILLPKIVQLPKAIKDKHLNCVCKDESVQTNIQEETPKEEIQSRPITPFSNEKILQTCDYEQKGITKDNGEQICICESGHPKAIHKEISECTCETLEIESSKDVSTCKSTNTEVNIQYTCSCPDSDSHDEEDTCSCTETIESKPESDTCSCTESIESKSDVCSCEDETAKKSNNKLECGCDLQEDKEYEECQCSSEELSEDESKNKDLGKCKCIEEVYKCAAMQPSEQDCKCQCICQETDCSTLYIFNDCKCGHDRDSVDTVLEVTDNLIEINQVKADPPNAEKIQKLSSKPPIDYGDSVATILEITNDLLKRDNKTPSSAEPAPKVTQAFGEYKGLKFPVNPGSQDSVKTILEITDNLLNKSACVEKTEAVKEPPSPPQPTQETITPTSKEEEKKTAVCSTLKPKVDSKESVKTIMEITDNLVKKDNDNVTPDAAPVIVNKPKKCAALIKGVDGQESVETILEITDNLGQNVLKKSASDSQFNSCKCSIETQTPCRAASMAQSQSSASKKSSCRCNQSNHQKVPEIIKAHTSDRFNKDIVRTTVSSLTETMKPLKEALHQLREKIRDLNLPETNAMIMEPGNENICPPCGKRYMKSFYGLGTSISPYSRPYYECHSYGNDYGKTYATMTKTSKPPKRYGTSIDPGPCPFMELFNEMFNADMCPCVDSSNYSSKSSDRSETGGESSDTENVCSSFKSGSSSR